MSLVSDTHGRVVERLSHITPNYKPEETALIILGDAGINFYLNKTDTKNKKNINVTGYTIYCVRGNHEERPENIPTMEELYDEDIDGIVYYEENSSLNSGDTILYIETDALAIEEFEKGKIKERLLQKKKKRELEKIAMQELIDEGMFFPESSKRPPIPKEVADAVWNRDGGKCVYCGSTENLQFDHIIPFSKGGATTIENLQLLCQKCNSEKSNKIG